MKNKVYLAGPGVFRPDSIQHGEHLKELCKQNGLIGLYPMDNVIKGEGKELAKAIFDANVTMIHQADAVIADMTPFRGPGMDGGTAWEMGMAFALKKTMVGYTEDSKDYLNRVKTRSNLVKNDGYWRDEHFMAVEDFGLTDNLMMSCSATTQVDLIFPNAEIAIINLAQILKYSLF